jgi:hypothetical protein
MSILTAAIPLPYRILAGVLLIGGLTLGGYFYGLHVGKLDSKVAIANFQVNKDNEKIDLSEIQSNVVTKIVTKYVTKTVRIKDVGDYNASIINKYVTDHGFLSNGWVYAHDASAAGIPIEPTSAANGTASTVEADQALAVVNENYTTCNQYREQIIGLTGYISGYNAAVTKANEDAKKTSK